MIIWDTDNKRMVDEETGDYMEKVLRDREKSEYSVVLFSPKAVPYLAARLLDDSTKEFETPMGGATVVRWILEEAWIPSGRPEPPSNFDVSDDLIERLKLFLKRDLETNSYNFMPRFEFVDVRHLEGPEA
jgi:hypothetical protein